MQTPIHTPDESATAIGAFFCLLWLVILMWWLVGKSHAIAETVAWFRRKAVPAKIFIVCAFCAVLTYGSIKGDGNAPQGFPRPPILLQVLELPPEPATAPVSVWTDGVIFRAESTNAVEITAFRTVGGSELGDWIETAAPFFAVGTNPVSRCYVSASGSISFYSMRRPPVGSPLPDLWVPPSERGVAQSAGGSTSYSVLCPLRAPLGMVPEANWTNANTQSRFWHDFLPSGGRVLTWENALVDRLPGRRVTLQVELRPTGDSVFRYAFQDELDPPPTNFVMGAQMGTNGVNALSILGTNALAATVWNVDGAPVTNGVSIADLLCTNGVLRTPAAFEIRWKNTTGLDPEADTDNDGLTDWAETFVWGTDPNHADTDGDGTADNVELMMGADPFDADEDGDGVPDGTSAAAWAGHPLWALNATNTAHAVTITLNSAVPAGASASLMVGSLCIPLRSPGSWSLGLVPGELYHYRLNVCGGAVVNLSIAPTCGLESPDLFPFWLEGDGDVFDEPSPGGAGNMAVPVLTLEWINPGDGSHENNDEACIHSENGSVYQYDLLPAALNAIPDAIVLGGFARQGTSALYLPIGSGGGRAIGYVEPHEGFLRWGHLFYDKSAHRCQTSPGNPYCLGCGHYMPTGLSLYLSKTVLTLKHDNEMDISILHEEDPSSTVSDPSIQIRRLGETNWLELAASESVTSWTARVAGYFELQGKITVDGQDAYTDIRSLEVMFPSYVEIWSDPTFLSLADARWRSILRNTVETNRFEQGFWVKLNTETAEYFHDEIKYGPGVTSNQVAYVVLGSRPADNPLLPSPLASAAIYTVASFHGHTPTTYRVGGRVIGPSGDDISADANNQTPGIVYDYEEWRNGTGVIPEGWPKSSPAKLYKTPGLVRRPTPQ